MNGARRTRTTLTRHALTALVFAGYLAIFLLCLLGTAAVFIAILIGLCIDLLLGSLAGDLRARLRRPRF